MHDNETDSIMQTNNTSSISLNAQTKRMANAALGRLKRGSVVLIAIIAVATSFAVSAKAPYHVAAKPIKDHLGRVQVIVDFLDDAHLSFPGKNQDPERNGATVSGEFAHKEKSLALVSDFELRHDIKRLGMTSWVGNSMTALVPQGQLEKILAEPLVKQVSEDEEHKFSAFSPPWYNYNFNPEWMSWGGDAVNAKISTGNTGRKIYIVDSGVAYHSDLPSLVRKNVACGSSGNCYANDPSTYPLVGCYAHATHVAGIIGASGGNGATTRGVYAGFPNMVSLNVSKRLTSDDCSTRDSATLSSYIGYALDYISWDNTTNNPSKIIHVVNMSINPGGTQYINLNQPGPNWGKVQGLASGIWMNGIQIVAGVLFVQASGNYPSLNSQDACLGAYRPGYGQSASINDGVMVVGAVNAQGRAVSSSEPFTQPYPAGLGGLSSYEQSTYGSCVDIWAPGDSIVSTWGAHSGPTLSSHLYAGNVYAYGSTEGWGFLSGTSMAAPHVAAVAAWLADAFGVSTSGQLETLVRSYSNQHNGAVDAAGFPVKVPRLP